MASICFDESRNLIGSDEAGFTQYAIFIAQFFSSNVSDFELCPRVTFFLIFYKRTMPSALNCSRVLARKKVLSVKRKLGKFSRPIKE
jgi:hypothetical protein